MKVIDAGRAPNGQSLVRLQFKKGIPPEMQKHQTVQVTVTMPYVRGKGLLQPLEKKTLVYYNTTFMEAVMKAQQKYRGASISVSTLGWKPRDEKETAGGNA